MGFGKAAELAASLKPPLWGLCILAAFMDIFFNSLVRTFLGFPLFLDTVFTATITFAFGLVPGILVAVLGYVVAGFYYGRFHFFVICSIAEVFLIYALKPKPTAVPYFSSRERIIAAYTGIAARLIVLYFACAIAISVLGGTIEYATHLFLGIQLNYLSPEDIFRPALIMANLPFIAENILARIPVNLVGRFAVVFGGYFASLGLVWLLRRTATIGGAAVASLLKSAEKAYSKDGKGDME